MGILNSLFNKKKETPMVSVSIEKRESPNYQKEQQPAPAISTTVQDLAAVFFAEHFRIDEKNYPDYLRASYGIGFPQEKFKEMERKGYLRVSTATESLQHLKTNELKEIATKNGLKGSGKKEEICNRIAENVSDEVLSEQIKERYWMVTEYGKSFLKEYPYIYFCMEKHPYSLNDIGLDIKAIEKLFSNKPKGGVRDVLWGEFNRLSLEYVKDGFTTGNFRNYCELLHVMALFLEEENRHKDALATYMRYIHYRVNFDACLSALRLYSLTKNIDSAVNTFFLSAEIYPFIANEILSISNGCSFDSYHLKEFMYNAFEKDPNEGALSPSELTDFVMYGLNGNKEGQKQLCRIALETGLKKQR